MTIQQLKQQTAAAVYQKKLKEEADHEAWIAAKVKELDTKCEEAANAGQYEAHMAGAGGWSHRQFADIKKYYRDHGFTIRAYTISWK